MNLLKEATHVLQPLQIVYVSITNATWVVDESASVIFSQGI